MNFSEPQIANASIIARTGLELGASVKQIVSALEASWVESRLGILDGGDNGTAWGIFQQRPVAGWGTKQQVQNPYYASRAFFQGVGTNTGLLDIWNQNLTEGQNAQRVQRSRFPARYDAAKTVAGEVFLKLQSILFGEGFYSAQIEAKDSLPTPDLKRPTPQTSNSQRIVVLSVGLVLILLAVGRLS